MRLYLYAIAEGIDDFAGLKGLAEEPLTVIPVGTASVVGGWMADVPAVSRETLVNQDALVRTLHAHAAALLPMRFGSSVADVDALVRLVDPLAAQVGKQCALVRGREQMTVRVIRTRTEGADGAEGADSAEGAAALGAWGAKGAVGAGARYLAGRAAKQTPPEIVPLLEALRDLQRATRVDASRHQNVVGSIYQLIDRGLADQYRQRVTSAATALPDLNVRVSGPAPPYAFASLTAP